jgi:hypothetical protein
MLALDLPRIVAFDDATVAGELVFELLAQRQPADTGDANGLAAPRVHGPWAVPMRLAGRRVTLAHGPTCPLTPIALLLLRAWLAAALLLGLRTLAAPVDALLLGLLGLALGR